MKVIAISSRSRMFSLGLTKKTCPIGLMTLIGENNERNIIIYNEDISEIISKEKADKYQVDLVLLSMNAGNTVRSLKLSKILKEDKRLIVIGGPEVSMIGPRFLKDNRYFDAMVIGPGNDIIQELVTSRKKVYGSNIIWREQNLDCDPLEYTPSYKRLDFENARIDYGLLHDFDKYKGLSYFWGNDCAQANNRCFFCGRLSMGVGYRPAEIVWTELLYAYRRGIRFFYNTTDSVSANVRKFAEFCNAKPSEMTDDEHRVFVNSREVDKDLIEPLLRLNGIAVLGIESISNFNNAGKVKTDVNTNYKAIDILYDSKIRMVLSFVFGLPGETAESIELNEKGILDIVSYFGDKIDSIHISPLLITTGSPAFKQMMTIPAIRKKYISKPVPYDAIEMSDDYFKNYCHITRDYCIERIFHLSGQVKKIAPHIKIGAKGITNEEEAKYSKQYSSNYCDKMDLPLLIRN